MIKYIHFNIKHLSLIVWLSMSLLGAIAQPVTVNTTVSTTGYTGTNSAGTGATAYVTFAIQNNSGVPIKLTKVGNYVITGDGPHTLYYSTTSLSGAVDLTLTSVWLNAGGTNSTIPSATASVQEVLNNINFVIPRGATYRFALQKASGTNRYSGTGAGSCSPSIFTNNSVSLLCGDATIGGSNVGYAGGNNPRWFTGFVTYEPIPQGPNNASIAKFVSPSGSFCSGNKDIEVRVKNSGTNIINNVTIQWELDNVLQTPVFWTYPIDTFGGLLYPSDTAISLATNIPFTSARTLKAWTEFPNGVTDTVNTDDTLKITVAPALNGNFTIGGTSPDFATIQAAVAALKSTGVCGPVHFEVRPGTYSGQIDLSAVAGVSATNTIIFEGTDKATTIVTHAFTTGEYATWLIANVSYVTLRNLTINATHTANAWGIRLSNAHNCKIINCNVNVPLLSSSTSMGIVVSGSPTSYTTAGRADYLQIDSVTVTGGYISISSYGATGTGVNVGCKLTNTQMIDYYYAGLYQYYSSSLTVSNNSITHLNTTASTYGMYFSQLGNASSISNIITNNKVNSIGSYGMYFTTATNPSTTNKGLITNNIIYTGSTIYGLYLSGGTNWSIAHNTSYFNSINATVTYVPAYITGGSAIACFNNIFRTLSSTNYSFYGSAATIFDTLNYNNYSKDVKGANYFYLGAAFTNVTMIGAGSRNTNSSSLDPDFTSITSLIPKNTCLSGMPAPAVVSDITGITRSTTQPTMGAYEVTPVALDARVEALSQPQNLAIIGYQDAAVLIRNSGTNTLTSVNVNIRVNSAPPVTVTWFGTLAQCDTVTVPFIGGSQINLDSISRIVVYTSDPNSSADMNTANDTIKLDMYSPMSGLYTIGGAGANFVDVNEAVTILKKAGVSGPVTFKVNPGTYAGQITLSAVSGVSSTNTITFEGANKATTIITHSYTTGEYATWITDNISYVTLRNLTINATHASNAWGIRLNNANYCKIINCNVNVPVLNASTSMGIVVSGSAVSYSTAGRADYLEIDSVIVTGGYMSISSYGGSASISLGFKLTHTKMTDYYYAGLYQYYSSSITVSDNSVVHLNPTASTYGMYFSQLANAGGTANIITNNIVQSIGSYGMYFTTATNPAVSNKGVIANNVINGGSTIYGLYLSAGTNWRMVHNTIFFNTINTTVSYVPAYITGGSGIACFNNIFRTLKTVGYTFYGSAATIFDTLDYNVYSKDLKGADYFYLGSTLTDVTLIGSGSRNANAKTVNPAFTDESIGNLIPLSSNVDNTAIPVAGITTDITGAVRSVTPDPGAYEFTGIAGDIALTKASTVRSSNCYSAADTVFVSVKNLIGSAIDFSVNPLTVTWNSAGPVNSTGTILISTGTLNSDATLLLYSITLDRSLPGNYSLTAYIDSTAVNSSPLNDTLNTAVLSEVKPILSMAQSTFTVTSPTDTVILEARSPIFPAGDVFFSEISHYQYTVGAPAGGWPAYLIADDYVEITGVPSSDLAGYTMEEWSTTAMTHTVTFPAGTVFSPNGTMILATGQLNASVPSPANFYYHTGNTITHGSGDNSGYLLKNPQGAIVDAAGYGSGYSFPVISGVTVSDWSGATPAGTTTAGNKLNGPDNNTSSNWVNSATVVQNPNVLNAGVSLPAPIALTGLTWYHNGSAIATDTAKLVVGPWTTPGIYQYIAMYTNACGTFYDTVFVTATSTVPVKLVSFTAKATDRNAVLNWQTASEVNNSHFEVQRSTDGKEFKTIHSVKGKGTTNKLSSYSFMDENAADVANTVYYRLKQVDLDGTSNLSKTATVIFTPEKNNEFVVYPNPFNNQAFIDVVSANTAEVTIEILDMQGRIIRKQTSQVKAGNSKLLVEGTEQLEKGFYFIRTSNGSYTKVNSVIKN